MKKKAPFGVLMIHGIIGTPLHFAPFLPLIPEDVPRLNLLLDGHGKGVKDFAKTSMKIWERQVQKGMDQLLSKVEKVVILAHSMGTLFAIEKAICHPENIAGLFLLNPPLRVHCPPSTMLSYLRIALGAVKESDRELITMQKSCSIALTPKLWQYIPWLPRYLELFAKIAETDRLLPRLKVPALAFHAKNDELVSDRSLSVLRRYPVFTVTVLPHSGHFYYEERELSLLLRQFSQILSFAQGETP